MPIAIAVKTPPFNLLMSTMISIACSIKINKHTDIDSKTGKTAEIDVFDVASMPQELKDESGDFVDLNCSKLLSTGLCQAGK